MKGSETGKICKFVHGYTEVWLYIEFLFHIFYYFWSKESCSFYPGLCCNRSLLNRGSTVYTAKIILAIFICEYTFCNTQEFRTQAPNADV